MKLITNKYSISIIRYRIHNESDTKYFIFDIIKKKKYYQSQVKRHLKRSYKNISFTLISIWLRQSMFKENIPHLSSNNGCQGTPALSVKSHLKVSRTHQNDNILSQKKRPIYGISTMACLHFLAFRLFKNSPRLLHSCIALIFFLHGK